MNNAKSLLTINYKNDSAKNFVSSISDENFYFFVGNHVNANSVVRPFDNEQDTTVSSYHGMVFGKRINSNDTHLMVRRIDWTSNTVYDIYDHTDELLYSRDFYVAVEEGTNWNVFKCLENGGGNPSTVIPSYTNVGANEEDFYYPTDGYRWKYMYSISDANFDKFATPDYIPVETNAVVKSKAVSGSLDVIAVTSPGKGYNNYLDGAFGVGDVRLNGDPKKYAISTVGAKNVNGYYDACWLYVSSGAGAGQYRMIESYAANATHNYVILTEQFDSTDQPQNGSVFEITPSVFIKGDGREVTTANARAIINPTGNTISRIEMIDRGENYFHATATITAAGSVGVTTTATILPILSPVGGHGYCAETELGGKYAAVSMKLVGTESDTIITDNDYSQIGIVKNPKFRSVEMTLTGANRDFYTNEYVYRIKTAQLQGTAQSNLDANSALTTVWTVAGVNAHSIATVGNTLLISDGTNYQLANVISVANTSLTMDAAALWNTGTGTANIHLATTNSIGVVNGFSAGAVILTDVVGDFAVGDKIIGAKTGVFAQVATVNISGVTKNFSTYMQTYTYIGSMTNGSFTADEIVYQLDNDDIAARFHSIGPDSATSTFKIYTTEQMGVFNTSNDDPNISDEIKGLSSGATAELTNKYLPDLVYGSGEIVYIEYGDSITRYAEKTETFKLVFAF